MYGFIYITTNHINGKRYIGQKKYDKQGYWKEYLGSGIILAKAIEKYGRDNFSKEIIEECESKEKLNDREKYWISHYDAVNSDNFYNLALGGDGGNTLVGYTSEQLREHSKILSKSLKGVINQGENNPRSKKVICLNNMQIFNTTVDASRYAEVSDVSIQSCCNGKTYTSGIDKITGEKLQWEYYNPQKHYVLKEIKRKITIQILEKLFVIQLVKFLILQKKHHKNIIYLMVEYVHVVIFNIQHMELYLMERDCNGFIMIITCLKILI